LAGLDQPKQLLVKINTIPAEPRTHAITGSMFSNDVRRTGDKGFKKRGSSLTTN